jgi:hypothetical protein
MLALNQFQGGHFMVATQPIGVFGYTRSLPTLFYRNSGVFDLGGNLLASGSLRSDDISKLQQRLSANETLIVVDLADTCIRPFANDENRREVLALILQRAPFLITNNSMFLVARLNSFFRKRFAMGDFEITVLDPESAKSLILAAQ